MMYKATLALFALCALHSTMGIAQSNPLVASKYQVQQNIRNINMQISTNLREAGMKINMIRSQQSFVLRSLISQIKLSPAVACAVAGLQGADSVWPLINNLEACRMGQNYNIAKQSALPVLNQLIGEAERLIKSCTASADYLECATNGAAGINTTGDDTFNRAINEIGAIAAESGKCIDDSNYSIQGRIDAVSSDWNACQAN